MDAVTCDKHHFWNRKKMDFSAIQNLLDPYERKARVFPALLVALPLLVPLLWIFGPKNPLLTALLGLISGCGVIYALASIARGLGKRLETKLVVEWSGMPTTLILRHRDKFLDSLSKLRYHSEIKSKLGITLPDAEAEAKNPDVADDAYIGATRQLRELTRGKANALLLKENIAYGFHRNMRGMRTLGMSSCAVGIFLGLVLSKTLLLKPLSFDLGGLADPGLAGGTTLSTSIALLIGWFYFTKAAVKQMGYVYAERLFESLKSLPKKPTKTQTTKQHDET